MLLQVNFFHLITALRKMTHSLQVLLLEANTYVTWMETETKGTIHSTMLYAQPIHIGERLADEFFAEKKCYFYICYIDGEPYF